MATRRSRSQSACLAWHCDERSNTSALQGASWQRSRIWQTKVKPPAAPPNSDGESVICLSAGATAGVGCQPPGEKPVDVMAPAPRPPRGDACGTCKMNDIKQMPEEK